MIYVRFTVVLGLLAAVWAQSLPAHGEAFRLSVAVDSQRRPTLSMSGLTAGRYLLEASTNLSQWSSVMSAPAGTGAFSFVHSEAAQLGKCWKPAGLRRFIPKTAGVRDSTSTFPLCSSASSETR